MLSSSDMLKDFQKNDVSLQIRFFLLVPLIIREKKKCKVLIDSKTVEEQSEFSKTKKRRFMFQCEKFIKKYVSSRKSFKTLMIKDEIIKVYPGFYKLGFDNYIQCTASVAKVLEFLNRKMIFHRMKIAFIMFKVGSFYIKLKKMRALLLKGIPNKLKILAFEKISNFSTLVKKVVFIQKFIKRRQRRRRKTSFDSSKLPMFLKIIYTRYQKVLGMEQRYFMNLLSSMASQVNPKIPF